MEKIEKAPENVGKILIIVESPNKIKKIQSFLGSKYVIRASYGHVRDLLEKPKYKFGININGDFDVSYGILKDKKSIVDSIIDASSYVDKIYLATDPDREGEAIAWHLAQILESSGKPIKRITFNEITKKAVLNALKKPRDINFNLFEAQQSRRVADRLVGFLASEFLRSYFKENFSAGRVQSVAAKLIIDRERQISSFQKEEYWNVVSNLKINNEDFEAKLLEKITNAADALLAKTHLESYNYIVSKVDAKSKLKESLPPLITSTMQQLASSILGFNVTRTMKAAQSLYEIGLITYLRTDSTRCSPEAEQELFNYLKSVNYDYVSKPNTFGTSSSSQDAHECIRPTDVFKTPDKIFVDSDQEELYKLIWQRFVASQMSSAVFDTVDVTINCNNKTLKASGKILTKEGWLSICPYHKGKDDKLLPNMKVGDNLILNNVKCEQKFTQPPARYTESTLLKELESKQIGRPSTYADIIEKIKDRNYVDLINKSYHGTKVGEKVIDILSNYYSFMDYKYTAKLENDLDEVEFGIIDYRLFITNFFILFQNEFKNAQLKNSVDYNYNCIKCKNKMILNNSKFGFYMKCSNHPKCSHTESIDFIDGKVFDAANYKICNDYKCPKCNSGVKYKSNHFGPMMICIKSDCNGVIPYYFSDCKICKSKSVIKFFGNKVFETCENEECSFKQELSEEESSKFYPKKLKLKEDNV